MIDLGAPNATDFVRLDASERTQIAIDTSYRTPFTAPEAVPVKIADFPVRLNGVPLHSGRNRWIDDLAGSDSPYSVDDQYPLLVYKDITYFPMTEYINNLLNLDSSWSPEYGLAIRQGNPDEWKFFRYEETDTKNSAGQYAKIIHSPITINGKSVDNEKEPYPLLVFRAVAYFPLTWRFAVDAFGWRHGSRMDNTDDENVSGEYSR